MSFCSWQRGLPWEFAGFVFWTFYAFVLTASLTSMVLTAGISGWFCFQCCLAARSGCWCWGRPSTPPPSTWRSTARCDTHCAPLLVHYHQILIYGACKKLLLFIHIHRMSSLHLKRRRHTNKQTKAHWTKWEEKKKKKLISLLKTLCIYILILGKEKKEWKKHLPKFYWGVKVHRLCIVELVDWFVRVIS